MSAIAQPRNARSARTRTAILDAAWRLLEEHGPMATTMEAVATAAGVTRRGLYLHFATRTDLFVALIQHVDQVLDVDASTRPVLEAPDALAALDAWAAHLSRYHARIRRAVDAIDRARASDPAAAAAWSTVMVRWQSGAEYVAARLAEQSKLAPGWTVPVAAEAIWALMLAFNPLWQALVDEQGWSADQCQAFLARLHRATFTV
jgi:AcrR family transcriptional regulator